MDCTAQPEIDNPPAREAFFLEIPIDDVTIPDRRRGVDQEKVVALADSIQEVGLLHPIGVTPENRLIYGRNRIEAFKVLGWKTIPAMVHDLDELHAELAEIDENLRRHDLTQIEEVAALKRRKEIYLGLHPETKKGGAPGKPGGGKKAKSDKVSSFAEDTAKQTGKSARTVQRDVAIAEKISEDLLAEVKETPIADNKSELTKLSKLPKKEQRAAVARLASGEAKTVAEATKAPEPVLDGNGKKVPEHFREIFRTRGEYRSINRELEGIKKRLLKLAESEAGTFLDWRLCRADIDNVKNAVKFGTPYAVCRYCKGEGCKVCRQSGYLNQTVFKNAPKE